MDVTSTDVSYTGHSRVHATCHSQAGLALHHAKVVEKIRYFMLYFVRLPDSSPQCLHLFTKTREITLSFHLISALYRRGDFTRWFVMWWWRSASCVCAMMYVSMNGDLHSDNHNTHALMHRFFVTLMLCHDRLLATVWERYTHNHVSFPKPVFDLYTITGHSTRYRQSRGECRRLSARTHVFILLQCSM